MENEQPRDDIETVQRDRKERGETRDAHLEEAREQARRANAEARGRTKAKGDEAEAKHEPRRTTRKGTDEATMKAQARARFDGTDEEFEQEWPSIREQLASEDMQKGMERIRRRF